MHSYAHKDVTKTQLLLEITHGISRIQLSMPQRLGLSLSYIIPAQDKPKSDSKYHHTPSPHLMAVMKARRHSL